MMKIHNTMFFIYFSFSVDFIILVVDIFYRIYKYECDRTLLCVGLYGRGQCIYKNRVVYILVNTYFYYVIKCRE